MAIAVTRCMACGEELEPGLVFLGSTLCLDCRSAPGPRRLSLDPPIRVRVLNPGLVSDLERSLRRSSCVVELESRDTIQVRVPHAPSDEQARREVRLYLAIWRAQHGGARAELVPR